MGCARPKGFCPPALLPADLVEPDPVRMVLARSERVRRTQRRPDLRLRPAGVFSQDARDDRRRHPSPPGLHLTRVNQGVTLSTTIPGLSLPAGCNPPTRRRLAVPRTRRRSNCPPSRSARGRRAACPAPEPLAGIVIPGLRADSEVVLLGRDLVAQALGAEHVTPPEPGSQAARAGRSAAPPRARGWFRCGRQPATSAASTDGLH